MRRRSVHASLLGGVLAVEAIDATAVALGARSLAKPMS